MKKDFLKKIINNKICIILVIIICVRLLVYSNYSYYTLYPDTSSYTNYNYNILKGEIDVFRTPIYPYIIKLISMLSINQEMMYKGIALLQEVVSLISVIIIYITLKKEFKNQTINILTTIIYGCLPSIFTYNRVILTESLSISLFAIYFCLILKYIKKPTNIKNIEITLFTILLIMLRPSFIYLIIVLAIMFLLIFIFKKENRKQSIGGLVGLVCIISILLGYCYFNKKQNDFFGLSHVTQINQLDTVIQKGIYHTGDKLDQGIINIIEERLDGYGQTWYRTTTDKIMDEYTPKQVGEYLERCIKNNLGVYIQKTLEKISTIALSKCNEIYLIPITPNTINLSIYFIIVYFYTIYECVYIFIKIIKDKEMPLVNVLMFLCISGQLGTIILGAQAEYSRLFAPALTILVLAIAWHIDQSIKSKEKC